MADWQRTHTCGELRAIHVGQAVTLNGWVNTCRSYNNQVFVDLRDRYGITQVVFESDDKELTAIANSLGREFVLSVRGQVRPRLPGKENLKLATGAIEVEAKQAKVLNASPTPPIEVTEFGDELANEEVRLQYRYLDLRRRSLQDTLIMRHRHLQDDPRLSRRARLSRSRNAAAWARARRKGPATIWCPAGSTTANGTLCRSRRSCTSKS